MKPWRVWIILLLALLLPLRSTLAATMMMAPTHTPTTLAVTAIEHEAAPCPHHAAANADDESTHSDNQAHLLCDACNGQALNATARWTPVQHTPPISAAHRSERFDSVVPPIGHKPPIPA